VTPATTPYIRRNVWSLPAGDPTVDAYADAVAAMQARHDDDPTSWSYQAAMHGSLASPAKPLWNGCQHQGWFFLAWHRLFIYYFESIVRAAIIEAGGPKDWALPFWAYAAGGKQATLPTAFRDPTVDGEKNPLFVAERNPGINQGLALPSAITSASAALSRPRLRGRSQFGGGATGVAQFAQHTGQVEQTPHNDVHSLVGGRTGWMNDPDQAAQDPIFWLHHSNIDRLWFLWSKPPHENPTDPRWAQQKFSFFDEHANRVDKTPADALDIANQLGYTYEDAPA
jgi:tyrosinase-like protein/polyphenol oxidase-like protein